jgi:hypothetical protein
MAALSVYPTISLGTAHKVITYCQILGSCHIGFAGLRDVSTIVSVVLPNNEDVITLELNDKVKRVDTQISVELSGRQSMLLECVGCDFTNTFINYLICTVGLPSMDTSVLSNLEIIRMISPASSSSEFTSINCLPHEVIKGICVRKE